MSNTLKFRRNKLADTISRVTMPNKMQLESTLFVLEFPPSYSRLSAYTSGQGNLVVYEMITLNYMETPCPHRYL